MDRAEELAKRFRRRLGPYPHGSGLELPTAVIRSALVRSGAVMPALPKPSALHGFASARDRGLARIVDPERRADPVAADGFGPCNAPPEDQVSETIRRPAKPLRRDGAV